MNGVYEQELNICTQELSSIQSWIADNSLDSNVRFLTSYAVIRASGTIERVLKEMIFDVISLGSTEEAKSYLSRNIVEASFNPSTKKIEHLLPLLNSGWHSDFCNRVRATEQKEQLNSLVDLRNSFSHGSSITTSISDVVEYYHSGVWILRQLSEVLSC